LHKDFSRSSLVRLLSDWLPMEAPASRQDFAERLSQWVDVSGSITLHAAHQSTHSGGAVEAIGCEQGRCPGPAGAVPAGAGGPDRNRHGQDDNAHSESARPQPATRA
jgi:hypothetical protein